MIMINFDIYDIWLYKPSLSLSYWVYHMIGITKNGGCPPLLDKTHMEADALKPFKNRCLMFWINKGSRMQAYQLRH